MKIKLSKKQWQFIGKQAGWIKKAQFEFPEILKNDSYHFNEDETLQNEYDEILKNDLSGNKNPPPHHSRINTQKA